MGKLKPFLRRCILTRGIYKWLYRLKYRRNRKDLQDNYVELSRAIYDAFEKSGIQYAYACGSLLGLVREKQFMEHDNDIDLIAVVDEYDELSQLQEDVKPFGFCLEHYYMVGNDIVEYTFSYKGLHVTIDVFAVKRENGKVFGCCLYQKDNEKYASENEMSVSRTYYDDIVEFEYLDYWGVKLRVPKNRVSFLVSLYGEKWMIKDTNHNHELDPSFVATNQRGLRIDCNAVY